MVMRRLQLDQEFRRSRRYERLLRKANLALKQFNERTICLLDNRWPLFQRELFYQPGSTVRLYRVQECPDNVRTTS